MVNLHNNNPIGIFDSGMGGLTVRAEIARVLPAESLIYFGDGKNVPYGSKTPAEITTHTAAAIDTLLGRGAKMIVVACNAATAAAIDYLRATYNVPIIGMEPAVKPAALNTETGIIGVLATAAALNGRLYKATAARFSGTVKIVEAVGEGFVELVENDLEGTLEAFETVRKVLMPMLEAGADHIVLGCTHYPFLTPQIERVIGEFEARNGGKNGDGRGGKAVRIVDSAPAIARRTGDLLDKNNLRAEPDNRPEYQFFTSADEVYRRRLVRKSEK